MTDTEYKKLFDAKGREIPSQDRSHIAIIRPKELSLRNQIKKYLREELSLQAEQRGYETFEESQDFDIENEFDRPMQITQYEIMDDDPPVEQQPVDPDEDPEAQPEDLNDESRSDSPEGTEDEAPPAA